MVFSLHSEVKVVDLDEDMAILNVMEKKVEMELSDAGSLVLGKSTCPSRVLAFN